MCLGAEVRMQVEHTLELKDRLEDKCANQTALLSERDSEIAHLKSLLSLKEAEAAEAIRLRGQLSVVEASDVVKDNELRDLKERNFVLEGEKDVLSEKVTTLESVTAAKEAELASLSSQVAKLTSDLSGFQLLRDELISKVASLESERDSLSNHCLRSIEYLRVLGEAIGCAVNKGMQDGLAAGIDHGKARRDLSVIKAYDPFAKAKYVDAVNALRTMDFSLLYELRSKKDASIVDLMDSLRLEGPLAKIPGADDLQPSPEQLMLPIHRTEDDVPLSSRSLIGEASTSAAPASPEPITTFSTTFASSGVVPPLSISNDQVLDMKPHDEDPPVVTFEKQELDTSPE
ncbi:hypothetical protein Tco_0794761 [Tanacetum coccineum]